MKGIRWYLVLYLGMLALSGCMDEKSASPHTSKHSGAELQLNIAEAVNVAEAGNAEDPVVEKLPPETTLLPDLFEDSNEQQPRISGKPIMTHTDDNLQPQVQGAEITIEIPTQ